jgi:nucleoid DNA-binding protein
MERNKKEIIYALSIKHKKSLKEIEEIVNHQFKFTAMIISSGNFETIRLPYFGKFTVDKRRVKHINRLKNEKDSK